MMYMNKMLSREAAAERYGHIDLASRQWPDERKWMTLFEIPKGKFPNLMIQDTGIKASHFYINRDILRPLNDALMMAIGLNIDHLLLTYDGCLTLRTVRGSKTDLSTHAYGLAIDFNEATNQLGTEGEFDEQLAKCFTEQGFDWGKHFLRKDPMHFSYAWEGRFG